MVRYVLICLGATAPAKWRLRHRTHTFPPDLHRQFHHRWYAHRRALAKGAHQAIHLQNAWNKYGPEAFEFYVLEECEQDRAVLLAREQEYLDAFRPVFNNCIAAGSRLGSKNADYTRTQAAGRRRSARTTHCPRGHAYDEQNTYLTKRNQRVCLRCAAEKQTAKYQPKTVRRNAPTCRKGHEWTPENTITLPTGTRQCKACADIRREQRNERTRVRSATGIELRERRRADHERHREDRLAQMNEYREAHKAERREYDRQRRELFKAAGLPRDTKISMAELRTLAGA